RNANVGVAAALASWALIVLGGVTAAGDPAVMVAAHWAPGYLLLAVAGVGVALYATAGRRGGEIGWQ
ncbi:MAG TPA: hypothetical protein VGP33_07735, partial [Chloroflexota bacterium]|nr:hypothetical protein [Chloroflexota bacterium]